MHDGDRLPGSPAGRDAGGPPRLPPLADFLRRLAAGRPADWADRLRDDQRRRWAAGERARVEDYLRHAPGLGAEVEALLDLVYGEVLLREAAGDRPTLAEYQERFPAHREALARQWEVHQVLEAGAASGPALARTTGADPWATRAFAPSRGAAGGPPAGAPDISGYEIVRELGRGGNGVVYLARQRSLNRLVAVKMLTPESFSPGHGTDSGRGQAARIRAEAEMIARLQHPNIVAIHRVGVCEGQPYLVLEYVAGGSLAQRINGRPWPPATAAALVETLARTLAVVHENGIIHRDLKPANVLLHQPLDRDAESGPVSLSACIPKLVDFGLAKAADATRRGLTQTGELVGTPLYMAPEQAAGKNDQVGPATDQHALGVLFYELLTGRTPFTADNALDVLAQIVFADPPPPSRLARGVSADLDAVVLRCLAKDPARRYPGMLALAEDLHRVRHGYSSRERSVGAAGRLWLWGRRQPVVAVLFASVLLVLAGGLAAVGRQWRRAEAPRATAQGARRQAEEALRKEGAARAALEGQKAELRRALADEQVVLARSLTALAEAERLRHNFARAEEHLDACPPGVRAWEWRYLARLCRMRLATLDGPGDPVSSVAVSPPGEWLAAAGPAGKKAPAGGIDLARAGHGLGLRVWRAAGGKPAFLLAGQASVAFRPTARAVLAACHPEGGVVLYDLQAGPAPAARFGKAAYRSLAWGSDGRFLAAVRENAVDLWKRDENAGPLAFRAAPAPTDRWARALRAVAFRPGGKTLALAWSREVRFWDLERGRWVVDARVGAKKAAGLGLRVRQKDSAALTALAWAGPGRLVTAARDGVLRVYDYDGGQKRLDAPLFTLAGHTARVYDLCAAGQGVLASAGADGTVRVWDLAARQEQARLPGGRAVALDGKGERVLIAPLKRQPGVWATRPARAAVGQTWHAQQAPALAFSPRGVLLSGGGVTVQSHHPGTLRASGPPLVYPADVAALAYHPAGRWLAVGLAGKSAGGSLHVHDGRTGRDTPLPAHEGAAAAVAFSPDGRRLASANPQGKVFVWQQGTGGWGLARTLAAHRGLVGVAFGPDNRVLATAGEDGRLLLWDLEAGGPPRELQGRWGVQGSEGGEESRMKPPAVAFSPDGKQLAVPGRLGVVLLFDVRSGDEEARLVGHTSRVNAVAYAPDGRRLATGGADGAVRLWDPARGEEVLLLTGHTRSVLAVAFSPDGRYLATSARDRTVLVHEAPR
jgi:WD40 repeat protein